MPKYQIPNLEYIILLIEESLTVLIEATLPRITKRV